MPTPDDDTKAAAEAAAPAAPASVAAVAPPPVDGVGTEGEQDKERARWKKTLIIVGNHRLPGDGRPVIVVEERVISGTPHTDSFKAELKTKDYPAKADLYYRTDPAVVFPDGAPVVTLGRDVVQVAFWGFSDDPRGINVGPASPAYGAANLAYQRGAKEIEIVGLGEFEKEGLQPFLDALTSGGPTPFDASTPDIRAPAPDVKVTLA